MEQERIYIKDAADLLSRQQTTLRKWDQLDILPEALVPHRSDRGWRYWTPEQIEGIREWIRETDRRPGKGLKHYNPTERELEITLQKMRQPRKSKHRND